MACFTAPASAAIVTTLCRKKIPEKYHINWLNSLLWGGVAGLILEHVSHGEVVPWPPFFTAMRNPADTAAMVHEILTTGVAMLVTCVIVWVAMVLIAASLKTKSRLKAGQLSQ